MVCGVNYIKNENQKVYICRNRILIMKKILSFLLVSIFLINLASAAIITVEPNTFALDAMPGDVINKTVNITTSGNLAVYLNITSNPNITVTIDHSFPLIVENNITIEVQFDIPTGITPGSYDVYIEASTENIETVVTVTSSSSSGGGGGGTITRTVYVLSNGSTTYIKPNTTIITDTIYLTSDTNESKDDTETKDWSETEDNSGLSTIVKVLISLVAIGVIGGIGYAIYYNMYVKDNYTGEEYE